MPYSLVCSQFNSLILPQSSLDPLSFPALFLSLSAILSFQAANRKLARSAFIMPSTHTQLLQYPSVQTIRPGPGPQTPTIPEELGFGTETQERTTSPINVQDFQYPRKPVKTGRLTAADFEAEEAADTVAPNPTLNNRDIHVPTRTR